MKLWDVAYAHILTQEHAKRMLSEKDYQAFLCMSEEERRERLHELLTRSIAPLPLSMSCIFVPNGRCCLPVGTETRR